MLSENQQTTIAVGLGRAANETDDGGARFLGFIAVSMTIMSICSFVGGIFTILLMSSAKYSASSHSVYLRCLAVSDFLAILLECLIEIDGWLIHVNGNEKFIVHKHLETCLVLDNLRAVAYFFCSWFLVALAIDCFLFVAYPQKRQYWCSKTQSIHFAMIIAGSGTILILISVLANVNNIIAMHKSHDRSCDVQENEFTLGYYTFCYLILTLIVPVCIISTASTKAILKLRLVDQDSEASPSIMGKMQTIAFKRAIFTLSLICLLCAILLSPLTLLLVVEQIMIWANGSEGKLMGAGHRMFQLFNLVMTLSYCGKFYVLILVGHGYRSDFISLLCLNNRHETLREECSECENDLEDNKV